MLFVFGALGEFVVVKVLDVQYQLCLNRVPKGLPMVSRTLCVHLKCHLHPSWLADIFKYIDWTL